MLYVFVLYKLRIFSEIWLFDYCSNWTIIVIIEQF